MRARPILLTVATCFAVALPVAAQPASSSSLTRADLYGAVGWGHLHLGDAAPGNQWDHRSVHATAGAGWFWSDHLKTEVEADVSSRVSFYRFEYVQTAGGAVYRSSRVEVQGTSVGVVQHYQFLRNSWVHPFAGAGVDLRRQMRSEHLEPAVLYGGATPQATVVAPGRRIDGPSRWQARGLAQAGLKAYFSERAFGRFDVKVAWRGGVDDVVFRAGIGVDF
jgi:hypothetical protein